MKNDDKSKLIDQLQKLRKFQLGFSVVIIIVSLYTLKYKKIMWLLIALFIAYLFLKKKSSTIEEKIVKEETKEIAKKKASPKKKTTTKKKTSQKKSTD